MIDSDSIENAYYVDELINITVTIYWTFTVYQALCWDLDNPMMDVLILPFQEIGS